jgi:hypothetical protein
MYLLWKLPSWHYGTVIGFIFCLWNHVHDHIISLIGEIVPPFCWMPVPSKGSGKSCICVLVVYILALSVIFSIKFGNCSDSVVSFVFHFIVYFHYGLRDSYTTNVRSLCSNASDWFTDFPSYSSGISADRDITVIFLSGINYHFPPIPLLATTYCHTRIQIWNVD